MSDTDSTSPLIAAATSGDIAALRLALDAGAPIDQQDEAGWTAMMWAARSHQLETVKFLVAAGANPALRNGFNADAWDISANHYLENEADSSAIRKFLQASPSYEAGRAKLTAEADVLAKRIANLFAGRKRRQGVAYVNSDFMVNANYRGMQCLFRVFAGGVDLWIQNFRAGPMAISLHLEHRDNAVQPSDPGDWTAWPDEFPDLPLYYDARSATEEAMRKLPGDSVVRNSLRRLGLGRFEWLVVVPGQLRFRCVTDDVERIQARLDSIAEIFQRTNRPLLSPRLPVLLPKFVRGKSLADHRFGGGTAAPIACPTCGQSLLRIASFSLSDASLRGIAWKGDTIEVACCFACALPETSSLTVVNYASDPVVCHQSELMGIGEAEPFAERGFRLEPTPGKTSGRRTRVGGTPSWLQTDETPDCPGCGAPMSFLAQFMSTDKEMFGADMGAAFAFICEGCCSVATVVQSH